MPFMPCERVCIKKKEEKEKKMHVRGGAYAMRSRKRDGPRRIYKTLFMLLEITTDQIFQHSWLLREKKKKFTNQVSAGERLWNFIEYTISGFFFHYFKREEKNTMRYILYLLKNIHVLSNNIHHIFYFTLFLSHTHMYSQISYIFNFNSNLIKSCSV